MASVQNPSLYQNLNKWQNAHEVNTLATINCLNNLENKLNNNEISQKEYDSGYSAFLKIYAEEQAQIGYSFNFMGAKDSANKEDYLTQLTKLATGELNEKDSDKDGQISKAEYIMGEVYDSVGELTPEEKAQAALMASMTFDAINSLVLVDSNPDNDEIDGYLSQEDLQNFYKTLDGYNYNEETNNIEFDGVFDGAIDMEAFDAFLSEAIKGVSQEQQENLYNKYLEIFS